MEKVILKAEVREGAGKKIAKDLRRVGVVPSVVYRGGKDALKLKISSEDLDDVMHTKAGENVIITLEVSGEAKPKDRTVIIKEVQRHPVKGGIVHVDFNEISLTETLKVNVPLAPRGEAVGVKVDGGVLDHVMWELQVECLPAAIPEKIEFDVTNLKIGDAVYVKDIKAPQDVKITNDPELIAFIVKPPHIEVPKEAVAEEVTQPELIREKKEKEEAGEEAPAEAKPQAPEKGAKEPKKEEK